MSTDTSQICVTCAKQTMQSPGRLRLEVWALCLPLVIACNVSSCFASGVTLITHGYNANADDWVRVMADNVPTYARFPGTNFTIYKVTLTTDGTSFFTQLSRTNGSLPATTDSGEIILKLDWSALESGLAPLSTYTVAGEVSSFLQRSDGIPELAGHALAEFPLHLAGHSRGGSLINELSRRLGTNGLWVDHLTSLDPHPLNSDNNNDWPLSTVDASGSNTFANVLFRDNYWQDIGGFLVPTGESAAGAYNRQLTSLSGGYSSAHSDVHLWYHGTVDWRTPTSDGDASITSTERANWWEAYETQGMTAGFDYSLIGGADRLSPDQPLGPGFPAIKDGYNQYWDLGLSGTANRTGLPANNGAWPNIIKLNRLDTNTVVQSQSTWVRFYYQWARPDTTNATVSFYLDDDFNPLNTNQRLLKQMTVPGNGAAYVSYVNVNLTLDSTNAAPGYHALYATITGGGRTRHLYAPELVEVLASEQQPTLGIVPLNASQYLIGVDGLPGQTIVLQTSTDLLSWQPLATNTLATSQWLYTNSPPASPTQRFYRARLGP